MDRSFQGLVLSLCLHAVLVWILLHTNVPEVSQSETAEIVLIERDSQEEKKTFVTETEKDQKDLSETLRDQADLLSQFTKRVKRQMRARNTGPTRNSQSQPRPKGDPEGIAGDQQRGQGDRFLAPGGGQAMRQVVIGPSSIAEFIPGVEEGSFTALNTDQFTYYAFFSRMNEQVRNRWISMVRDYMSRLSRSELESLSRAERQTTVEIVLSRNGQFLNSLVHITSGDRHLDQTTVEAFRLAAPFLNPPQGMIESDGYIHLKYAFLVRFRPPTFGPEGY